MIVTSDWVTQGSVLREKSQGDALCFMVTQLFKVTYVKSFNTSFSYSRCSSNFKGCDVICVLWCDAAVTLEQ